MTRIDIPDLTRRRTLGGLVLAAGAAAAPLTASARQTNGAVSIHRHDQTLPFPVNAYLVEGPDGVVAIDATLTVTSATALRDKADALGKPLRAILLTHPHPDHYAGLSLLRAGRDIPILSTEGVAKVVVRDDAVKNDVIGGMFGAEWPTDRAFPDTVVQEGETLDFGNGLSFEVLDIGPAESHHDSVFLLHGEHRTAFAGDVAYGLMHSYMADDHNPDWQRAIERLRGDLPEDTVMHIGHGAPVTPGFLGWQADYIRAFEAAIMAADWADPEAAKAAVTARMHAVLPGDALLFLMQLSMEPVARGLGKL